MSRLAGCLRLLSTMAMPCIIAVSGSLMAAPEDQLDANIESNIESNLDTPWHPLRTDRVAEVREARPSAMGEVAFRRLSRAHELLGDSALIRAAEELDKLGMGGLNAYERAQVMQTYGFIYSQQGEQGKAFEAFEACIELDALPTEVQQGIVYSLASYYSSEGRHSESTRMIMRWFRFEPAPMPEAYVLVAINYSEQQEIARALPYARRANALAQPAREAWMQLELALLLEAKRYSEAVALLEEMIGMWPAALQYYETLSGVHVETGDNQRALAALMIPWLDGRLTQEDAVLKLVRLNLYLNYPARGAEILERSMRLGVVPPTQDNLELLLGAWTNARESGKAVEVIDRLAEVADDGRFLFEQALLLNESGDWHRTAEAAEKAIDRGGLERPGEAWTLRGIALTELERYEEAMHAFEGARREGGEAAGRTADAWIAYVRELSGE